MRKSEGTAMFQIERYKIDVQRLLEMVQQTKEYTQFAKFAQDNPGGAHFLKKSKKEFEKKCKCLIRGGQVDEKLYWAPKDAYNFAQEFKHKHKGQLTNELIE